MGIKDALYHFLGTQIESKIQPVFVAGGTSASAPGGGSTVRANTEWIFKPNASYMIRGINRAGTAQPMSVIVQGYEE